MRVHRHLRQAGFSLIELAISVLIAGLLSVLMAPTFNMLTTSNQLGYAEHQALINQEIADAMQETAKVRNDWNGTVPMRGRLPDPWTDLTNPVAPLYSTVTDPNSACSYSSGGAVKDLFACMLQRDNVNFLEVNDDNYDTHRARVYQKVTGLQATVPLFFSSGPQVTLTYDYGAIYMTSCQRGDATCLQTFGSQQVPGISPQLLANTIGGPAPWNTVRACASAACPGPDYAPVFVSSLPAQMQMMQQTADRLDRVRDALKDYFKTMQISSDASNQSNWYPYAPDSSGNQNLKQNNPLLGCMDGWYDLSNTSILNKVGLDPTEFGVTAWGVPVLFCRYYIGPNATAPSSPMPPYFGALLINSDLSSGVAPNPSNSSSTNVVLTF